jgi:hypothetical protein
VSRKERVSKIENLKDWKVSTLHVSMGERREIRSALGSRATRRRGTKGHSSLKRTTPATRARVKMRALLDKLMVKKITEAVGGSWFRNNSTATRRN